MERTFSVNDIGGPTITITTTTNVACYGGSTGAINITPAGGTPPYTYNWSNGASTEDISGIAAGNYGVVVVDAASCQAGTGTTILITQPAGPIQVNGVVTNVNCFGIPTGAIALTTAGGTPGYTYDWADIAGNSNPEDRTGLAAGTYMVTITDNTSCTLVQSYVVVQPAAA
jgi:hypothetical protein